VISIEGRRHSRAHTAGCKGTRGSILKYEAFVYLYVQLPGGESATWRMKLSDGNIVRCYQRGHRSSCARHPRADSQGRVMAPGLI
jgi:hypothetical protein